MQFFYTVWNQVRAFFGLIVPVFSKAGDFKGWGPGVWRFLHITAVVLFLLVLYVLNRAYAANVNQTFGTALPVIKRNFLFLPLLGAALVALGWLLYWLLTLYGPAGEDVEFNDIHEAWTTGLRWLAEEGITIDEVPLYLVLGKPAAGDEAFFRAAEFGLNVFAPNAGPVRFRANRHVVFVSAPDACLLSGLAEALPAGGSRTPDGPDDAPVTFGNMGQTVNVGALGGDFERVRELLAKKQDEGLDAEETAELAELSRGPSASALPQGPRLVAVSAKDRHRLTRRLSYLCRLIAAARSPVVPVNGVVLLVPWGALATDDQSKHLSELVRDELKTARAALRQRAACLAVVCDMETAAGFREFSARLSDDVRKQRFGQRLPLVPDVTAEETQELYEHAAAHLGQRTLALGVLRALRADASVRGPDGEPPLNRRLYYLYCESAERLPRLGRALKQGVPRPADGPDGYDGPPLLAGVYLAATGKEKWEQVFIPGIFQRVADETFQTAVAWTSDLVAEDKAYAAQARTGYLAMSVAGALSVLGAGWLLSRQ